MSRTERPCGKPSGPVDWSSGRSADHPKDQMLCRFTVTLATCFCRSLLAWFCRFAASLDRHEFDMLTLSTARCSLARALPRGGDSALLMPPKAACLEERPCVVRATSTWISVRRPTARERPPCWRSAPGRIGVAFANRYRTWRRLRRAKFADAQTEERCWSI